MRGGIGARKERGGGRSGIGDVMKEHNTTGKDGRLGTNLEEATCGPDYFFWQLVVLH